MNLVLEVDSLEGLEDRIQAWAESIKIPVQRAMAVKLAEIVDQNFQGQFDREDWPDLSDEYADVVGRPEATLILTSGEASRVNKYYGKSAVPGLLRASTAIETDDPDHARVFNDCEYAAVHQFGGTSAEGRPIPARPFFPVDDGKLRGLSQELVREAAIEAIRELMRG